MNSNSKLFISDYGSNFSGSDSDRKKDKNKGVSNIRKDQSIFLSQISNNNSTIIPRKVSTVSAFKSNISNRNKVDNVFDSNKAGDNHNYKGRRNQRFTSVIAPTNNRMKTQLSSNNLPSYNNKSDTNLPHVNNNNHIHNNNNNNKISKPA